MEKVLRWNVRKGEDIEFWGDSWIPNWKEDKLSTIQPLNCPWNKVADFVKQPASRRDEDNKELRFRRRGQSHCQYPHKPYDER